MEPAIRKYGENRIGDALDFEHRLRKKEDFWGWEINKTYIASARKSFDDREFDTFLSHQNVRNQTLSKKIWTGPFFA